MQDEDNEQARAEDAIPKDAIWLTDAYEFVVALVNERPELLSKFDEDWAEVLRKSRELEVSCTIQTRSTKSLSKMASAKKRLIYFCV
jgi:hypothetical protein